MVGMVKERLKGIEREYAELDTVWYMAGEPVHLCVTSPCVRCDCVCLLVVAEHQSKREFAELGTMGCLAGECPHAFSLMGC